MLGSNNDGIAPDRLPFPQEYTTKTIQPSSRVRPALLEPRRQPRARPVTSIRGHSIAVHGPLWEAAETKPLLEELRAELGTPNSMPMKILSRRARPFGLENKTAKPPFHFRQQVAGPSICLRWGGEPSFMPILILGPADRALRARTAGT
jgi:hypothetical protein